MKELPAIVHDNAHASGLGVTFLSHVHWLGQGQDRGRACLMVT